jgi:hypothetical protein
MFKDNQVEQLLERIKVENSSVTDTVTESGFCREDLMRWCEENNVLYVFGIARNSRLLKRIFKELKKARKRYFEQKKPQRIFKDFTYRTLTSWSRRRRVVGKAEYLGKGANPRFVVTNLPREVKS